jgi:hypothetical protein
MRRRSNRLREMVSQNGHMNPSVLTFAYEEDFVVDIERNHWLCVLLMRLSWLLLAFLGFEDGLAFPVFLLENNIALLPLQFCSLLSAHGVFAGCGRIVLQG